MRSISPVEVGGDKGRLKDGLGKESECVVCNVEEEDEDTESRGVTKMRVIPKGPTDQEREAHSRTHLPFRSWCPQCVAGRATAAAHATREREERSVAGMDFDYCFLRNRKAEESTPVLVSKDRGTSMIGAHVVPCKGAETEWVQQQIVRDLQKVGHYGRVVLKSDQEPAIVDVLKAAAKLRSPAETVIEHSRVEDSKTNGFIERGVRSFEEQLRVMKLDLEARIGEKLEVDTRMMAWLVEHSTDILNKFQVSRDGKTSYERLKGRKYNGEVLPFGQPVMLRTTGKVQGGVMSERWIDDLWLGKRFHSDAHVVCRLDEGTVVRIGSVKAMPMKLTRELFEKIKGAPWMPTGTYKQDAVMGRSMMKPEENKDEDAGQQPRSMRITEAMLDKHGYTASCRKCKAMMSGDVSQPTLGHTRDCRVRLEKVMEDDEHFQSRLRAAEDRKTRFLEGELKRTTTRGADEDKGKGKDATCAGQPMPAARHAKEDDKDDDGPEEKRRRKEDEEEKQEEEAPGRGRGNLVKRKVEEDRDDEETEERPTTRARLLQMACAMHEDEGEKDEADVGVVNLGFWEECVEQHVTVYDPIKVKKAKMEELKRFRDMKVYEVVLREEMTRRQEYTKLGVRWVITEKQMGLKARLVAQEFVSKRLDRDCLFAGTLGLNAMRLVIPDVAMRAGAGVRLMVADIKSAFLYGAARRDIFIEVPHEDSRGQGRR